MNLTNLVLIEDCFLSNKDLLFSSLNYVGYYYYFLNLIILDAIIVVFIITFVKPVIL